MFRKVVLKQHSQYCHQVWIGNVCFCTRTPRMRHIKNTRMVCCTPQTLSCVSPFAHDSFVLYNLGNDNEVVIEAVIKKYGTLCSIWYHLHNLKTVKNAHGGELLLVKLQAFYIYDNVLDTFSKLYIYIYIYIYCKSK